MPELSNPQHEQFARLVASGSSLIDAYHLVYPDVPRRSAQDKASRLAQRPEVEERLADLVEQNSDEAIWALAERLAYLRAVAYATPAEVNMGSPYCAGLHWTTTGPIYRMYDKVSALALYARLAGDLDAPAGPPPSVLGELMAAIRAGKVDQWSAARRPGTPLENTRHERFAQLVGSGERASYAYEKLYGISRTAARLEGYRLTQRPEVAARIASIRQRGAALVGWTRPQRMRYLRELAEAPIGDIDENSPFCQGFRRVDGGGPRVKIPNKLRAVQLYSRLAGARSAAHPTTIEQIAQGIRSRGNLGAAAGIESSLISYVAGPAVPKQATQPTPQLAA
ncbi:hypothetical protein BH09VER1_BH09VER1_10350 [soil metagenome]